MSLPITFSKSGVPTLIFSRGLQFPIIYNGKFIQLTFRGLMDEDIINIKSFFNNVNVNWSENNFTFTDQNNTTYDVRYWNNSDTQDLQVTEGGTAKVNTYYNDDNVLIYSQNSQKLFDLQFNLRLE